MKLLKQLLGGCPCSHSRRFRRRHSSNRTGQGFRVTPGRRKHQQVCDECRLRERREQQYLERLRGAAVPAASDDLTARLLARTGELARAAEPARTTGSVPGGAPAEAHLPAAGHPDPGAPSALHKALPGGGQPWGPARGGMRQRTRIAALTAGGAAAAVTLLAGSAYLLGDSAAPLAAGEASTAFLQKDLGVAAAMAPDTGPAPGWSMPGEPDISPADALSAGQLAALRAQGWSCPDLGDLGFHLVWARGGMAAGADVVELRLTDGRHFATVLEQHGFQLPREGRPGLQQTAAGPPVNVLTGHSAGADGFAAAGLPGTLRAAGNPAGNPTGALPGGGSGVSGGLWINPAPPFRAILQGSAGTFTYVSDQPADEAARGVAALVRTSAGRDKEVQVPETQVPETQGKKAQGPETQTGLRSSPTEATPAAVRGRLERGFGRILELLAP